MHKINPLNVEQLVSYIFDSNEASVNQFQADFSSPVLSICELLRESYVHYLKFDNHPDPDEQFSYLTAHVYSLVESLYTSTKLLVHGFLSPSGNQFRVALESTALSVLLSWRDKLQLQKRSPNWSHRDFFDDFKKGKRWARSHLAIKILAKNRDLLGLSGQALKLLEASKQLYNNYSHVSFLSIRATIVDEDKLVFGGGYDGEQKDLFAKELEIRKGFIEKVPSFIDTLYDRAATAAQNTS